MTSAPRALLRALASGAAILPALPAFPSAVSTTLATAAILPPLLPLARLSRILPPIALLAFLLLNRPFWRLPPAVMASILFVATLAHICPKISFAPPKLTTLTIRFALFYAAWLAAIITASLGNAPFSPIILCAVTCAMILIAHATIWPLALIPEWLGYKTRRDCFVPRSRYSLRFVCLAAAAACWIFFAIQYL